MSFENFIYQHYDVRETNREEMIRICCPFCGDENFHGYINTHMELFKCFKCKFSHKPDGEATTAYHFLKIIHNLTNKEVFKVLNFDGDALLNSPDRSVLDLLEEFFAEKDDRLIQVSLEEEIVKVDLPRGTKPILGDDSVVAKLAYKYLKSRFKGRDVDKIIKKYDLQYCNSGLYSGYIIIPVKEWGELVWYQGRAFLPANKEPKYLGMSNRNKSLFGLEFVDPDHVIILVEGVFDAMTLGDKALCCFGSSLSKHQYNILRELKPKKVVVCFDWDKSGVEGSLVACRKLKEFVPEVEVTLGMTEDANSLGRSAAIVKIVKSTIPFDTEGEVRLRMREGVI